MYIKLKRLTDLIFSLALILAMLIPMVVIAIIVKSTSAGPILFTQKRYGQNSKPFKVYKFRTMRIDAPEKSNQEFDSMDAYLTSVGSFLRMTSLDELPQLFNILEGHMSFIGPRPLADSDYDVIKARMNSGADNVKPGITGLAQVNGRNLLSDGEKAMYDYEYYKNFGFITDLKILIKTFLTVITRTGINHDV